jgi:hypothetical protein
VQRQRAEDHARSVKRLRGLVAALVLLLGFIGLLGAIAVRKSREATAQKASAELQRQRAEAAEKVAGERADSVKKTQESLAAFADSLIRVSGSAQQAQAFKDRADQAIAQANALEKKSANDVSAIVQAQKERDAAREEAEALRSQIDDYKTMQIRQSNQTGAPAEATLIITVTDVMALHDGTDNETKWDFQLIHEGYRFASIPPLDYDDSKSQPTKVTTPGATGRFPTREGAVETVTIGAKGEDTSAIGTFTVTVRPPNTTELLRVPVLAANDKKGAFVLFVQVRNVGPTAK